MLETALIVFREGLESFLIVALTVAFLRQTGKTSLTPAIAAGVVVALILSISVGYVADDFAEDALTSGILALISGGLVASMTYGVMKTAKSIRSNLTKTVEYHATKATIPALLGLFSFTVLMIAREGIETALMLGSMAQDTPLSTLISGGLLGLIATLVIGGLWIKNAHLINLRLFLQTTGVFLIIFSLHLAMYGIHELSEADALPFVDNFALHTATEDVEPNTPLGQAILYSMIAIPCLWLAYGIISDKIKKSKATT